MKPTKEVSCPKCNSTILTMGSKGLIGNTEFKRCYACGHEFDEKTDINILNLQLTIRNKYLYDAFSFAVGMILVWLVLGVFIIVSIIGALIIEVMP